MSLSQEQVDQFKKDGVLIAENVLTDADLQPLIDEIDKVVDERAQKLFAEGKITELHADKDFTQRLAYLQNEAPEIAQGLDIMQLRSKVVHAFLFNSNLLDAVESLIGPEIECNPIQHLRAKMPTKITGEAGGLAGNVPWHQDVAVTWEEADDSDIITCWLPLVDATEERGCMQVIPGVHDRGYMEHQAEGGTTIKEEYFPTDGKPFTAVCPKGGVVFMTRYTPHLGLPNKSETIRWTMDLRYQPTGQPSGRPFQPSFIVRSAENPDAIQDDYDDWCDQWDKALKNSRGYSGHRTTPKEKRIPADKQ